MEGNTATSGLAVIVKNTPPVAVTGASLFDWFQSLPASQILTWLTILWVLVQMGFFLRDKLKKKE